MNMDQLMREDARLIILRELEKQVDERLHSGFMVSVLFEFGIDKPMEWIHGELQWLAEMGAVTLMRAGSVVVATLSEKGHRHLRRALIIEGIKRPSRPGE